ncbi:MAG: RDD family protein, partial [Acidobacteriota bacterium]
FDAPSFDAPSFDAPAFDAPAFEDAPSFELPDIEEPVFDAEVAPSFELPEAVSPAFEAPPVGSDLPGVPDAPPATGSPSAFEVRDAPAAVPRAFEEQSAPPAAAPSAFEVQDAPPAAATSRPSSPVAFGAPPAFETPANAPGDEPPVQSWSTPETFAAESFDAPPLEPAAAPAFEAPRETGDAQRSTSADLLPTLDDITASVGPMEMRPPEPIAGLATGAVQAPEEDEAELAGLGLRTLAYLLDAVLFGGLAFAAFLVTESSLVSSAVSLLGAVVVVVCWAVAGTSPGKRALGLTIVNSEGESRLGVATAVLRAVGYVASAVPLGVGFLMVAFTKDKRGLHDKIAGTWVYRT